MAIRVTKTVYIDKIQIDDAEIKFGYIENTDKFYATSDHIPLNNGYNQKNLCLETIGITKPGASPKNFSFKYDNLGGFHGNRLFLSSLTEVGLNPYKFSYYNTDLIPDPLDRSIDHWGFWAGTYDNVSPLIPEVSQDKTTGDFSYTNDSRQPNGKVDVGMLETITYPTGGNTTFEYEANYYSKRLERRSDNKFLLKLYDVSNTKAGGARIRKITDNDGTTDTNEREFFYTTDFPTNTTSSGILLDWPRYVFYWESHPPSDPDQSTKYLQRRSLEFNVNYDQSEKFIHYSQVIEKQKNGSFTKYLFTSYEDTPDDNTAYTTKEQPFLKDDGIVIEDLYNNYVGIQNGDRSRERGKIKKIISGKIENNTLNPVRQQEYEYTGISEHPDQYQVSIYGTGGLIEAKKLYYYPILPKRITTIDFLPDVNTSVSTVENLTYNSNSLLQSKSKVQSDGSILKQQYTYVSDYPMSYLTFKGVGTADECDLEEKNCEVACAHSESSNCNYCINNYNRCMTNLYDRYSDIVPSDIYTAGIKGMQNKNMINYPIEELNSIIKDKVEFVTGSNLYFYKDMGTNLYKTYYTASFKTTTPITISDYVTSSVSQQGKFVFYTRNTPDIYYDAYNSYGLILQNHTVNDFNTSYIWGYNNTYPIAKAENAGSDDIFFDSFEDPSTLSKWLITGSGECSGNIPHNGDLSLFSVSTSASEKFYYTPELKISNTITRKYKVSCWVYCITSTSDLFLFYNLTSTPWHWDSFSTIPITAQNNWVYVEALLDVPANAKSIFARVDNNSVGAVYMDDIRIQPADTQMTTYTYKPLGGMTTSTDNNGRTTYYTYDSSNRLSEIKDADGNVLKHFDYNYKQ